MGVGVRGGGGKERTGFGFVHDLDLTFLVWETRWLEKALGGAIALFHGRVGGVTAVFDAGGRALYFSKEVIPWFDPATQDARGSAQSVNRYMDMSHSPSSSAVKRKRPSSNPTNVPLCAFVPMTIVSPCAEATAWTSDKRATAKHLGTDHTRRLRPVSIR